MPAATATPAPIKPNPPIPNNLLAIPPQSFFDLLSLLPSVVDDVVPSVIECEIPSVLPSEILKDFRDSAWPFISRH